MTTGHSISPSPEGSSVVPSPFRDAWDRQLADAFEVLLGRPLAEFDPEAVYAVRIGGNLIRETGFAGDAAWVRPAALRGAVPVVWDVPLVSDAGLPAFDASRSVFEVGMPEGRPCPLPADFLAAVRDVCFAPGLLRGVDLAPLAERFGVDLADPALAGSWAVFVPLLVSDGTLLDALRTTLATGRAPEDLLPFTTEPDEEWEEALEAVAHPGLRAHLGHFCTDGEEGLMPLHEDIAWAGGLEEYGCAAVTGWEDGFGQVDFTVVRLSGRVAGGGATGDAP
ncbi:hypothetical protein AB0D49_34070 [Streptomyces sp. NPDC048290]|uniref:hypothetical protein n=1 Tax=Streptomyces sp. NPDC048290 TaxID=3155811 RepID=UPI003442D543